jgi:rod shape-determining protein MreC
MGEMVGKANKQYNKIEYYFQLKNINQQLAKENELLRNKLKDNFTHADTINKIVTDSIPYDTLGNRRKWEYQMAKVVANSVSNPENFIQLNRGSKQGIQKDMGVVDPNNSVVGIITDVSDNFSVVMSLLHKDSRISAKLKKAGDVGMIVWDGKDPNILTLTDIRKSAKITKGDTVITSGFTTTFPLGFLVGTIEKITPDVETNNFIIKVKSSANFHNLQYVYSVNNLDRQEMNQLMEKSKVKTK